METEEKQVVYLPATAEIGDKISFCVSQEKEALFYSSLLDGSMQIVLPAKPRLPNSGKVEFIAGFVQGKMAWILIAENHEEGHHPAELQSQGKTIGILQ